MEYREKSSADLFLTTTPSKTARTSIHKLAVLYESTIISG
jgi:hypothetical protein